MKSKILIHIIYGIILITLLNCCKKNETKSINQEKPKTNSKIEKNTENQPELIYSISDKVELIIDNNAEFLIVGEPTKVYLKKENLYKRLYSATVEGNQNTDLTDPKIDVSGLRFIITATQEDLLRESIEIQLFEKDENGEDFIHKIVIPVKKKSEKN